MAGGVHALLSHGTYARCCVYATATTLEYHLYGPLDREMVIPDPHLGPPKGSKRGRNRSSAAPD